MNKVDHPQNEDSALSVDRPKLIILTSLTGKLLTENDQYEMDMGTQDQQNISVDRVLLDYMNEEVVRKWFNLRKNFSSRTTSWIESL